MTLDQIQSLISRFSQGQTTEEENKELFSALNESLEVLSVFLQGIKLAHQRGRAN